MKYTIQQAQQKYNAGEIAIENDAPDLPKLRKVTNRSNLKGSLKYYFKDSYGSTASDALPTDREIVKLSEIYNESELAKAIAWFASNYFDYESVRLLKLEVFEPAIDLFEWTDENILKAYNFKLSEIGTCKENLQVAEGQENHIPDVRKKVEQSINDAGERIDIANHRGESFRKQFKKDNPQTIGETDKYFDDSNYIDWLEMKLVKFIKPD